MSLIRIAAQRPEDKQRDITSWVNRSKTSMSKTAADFKVKVEAQPAVVDGRLLPAPVLEYGSPSHYYAGSVGAWNMVKVRYFPVRLDKFSLHPKRDRGNPRAQPCIAYKRLHYFRPCCTIVLH